MDDPTPPTASDRGRASEDTIVRGAALVFMAKVGGAAFTAVLVIFLTRALGTAAYGVFSLALSIVTLVDLPSDFGVAVAVPRFLADHRGDRRLLAELTADAIRLELLGTLMASTGLFALAGAIASAYQTPQLAWPLRAMAIALIGQNLLFFASGVFSAMRRQAPLLKASLVESATEFSASVTLVLILGGATAAAAGRAVGYAIGGMVSMALVVRLLGRGSVPRRLRTQGHGRRIIGYAVTLAVVDSVYTVFSVIDTLLIGGYLNASAVGLFSAPLRLITVLQYPAYAIATAVSPRLAGGERRAAPDVQAFAQATRLVILLMVPVVALSTVWAAPLLLVALGSKYAGSASVLRALGPYVLLVGEAALASSAMNYLGAGARRLPIAAATVIANAVVDVILIPRIGIVGGAVGSDIGFVIYVLAQARICHQLLGLSARPFVISFGRAGVAGLVMAGVLVAFGTGKLPVLALIAGAILGLLAYGAVLVVLREVSRDELSALSRRARVVRRARPG